MRWNDDRRVIAALDRASAVVERLTWLLTGTGVRCDRCVQMSTEIEWLLDAHT